VGNNDILFLVVYYESFDFLYGKVKFFCILVAEVVAF
jgi:hypothetical protein